MASGDKVRVLIVDEEILASLRIRKKKSRNLDDKKTQV